MTSKLKDRNERWNKNKKIYVNIYAEEDKDMMLVLEELIWNSLSSKIE